MTSRDSESQVIRDNVEASRFEMDCEGGGVAFMTYRREGDVLVIPYAEVPPALRGRGVGDRLVLAALEQVRSQGLKVKPLCPFVHAVMRRNRETLDLMA